MKLILAIALAGLLGIAIAIIFFLPEQSPMVDSGQMTGSAAGPEGGQSGETGIVSGEGTDQAAGVTGLLECLFKAFLISL